MIRMFILKWNQNFINDLSSKSKRKIEAFLIISPCEKEEEKNWTHLHGDNNPNTLLKRTKRLSGLERSGVTFRSLYKHAKIINNGRCINRFLRETITTPCNPRATAAFVITLWLLIIMHCQPLHSSWPRCVHLHGVKRVATTFTFFFFSFFLLFRVRPTQSCLIFNAFFLFFLFSFFVAFLYWLWSRHSNHSFARQRFVAIRRMSLTSRSNWKLDRIDLYSIEELLTNVIRQVWIKFSFFYIYFVFKIHWINEIINKTTRILHVQSYEFL